MAMRRKWDLRGFADEVNGLDMQAFRERFPDPFLLVKTGGRGWPSVFGAVLCDETEKSPTEVYAKTPGKDPGGDLVFVVAKSGRNEFADMITIGRSVSNDIILVHPYLSKMHAYLRKAKDGRGWVVVDPGSSNGTLVRKQRLETNVLYDLTPGDRIQFGGAVVSYFLDVEGMYDTVQGYLLLRGGE